MIFGDDYLHRNFLNLHRHLICLGEKFHQLSANSVEQQQKQQEQQQTTIINNQLNNYDTVHYNYLNDVQFQQVLSDKVVELFEYHSAYFRSNYCSQMQKQHQILQQQQLMNVVSELKQMQPSNTTTTSDGNNSVLIDTNESIDVNSPIPCATISDNDSSDHSDDDACNMNSSGDNRTEDYSGNYSTNCNNSNKELFEEIEQDKAILLELKEKYRFLPLLIAFIITTLPRNILNDKDRTQILFIRDNILEMYVKDYSWLENITLMMDGDIQTNSSNDNGTSKTKKPCLIEAINEQDIQKATMSNILMKIYETLCLVNRLAAIFKIQFEL